MPHLPLSISSGSLHCLLIGGGKVAHRKLATLISHEVSPRIVAAEVNVSVQQQIQEYGLNCEIRRFHESDLDDVNLVVCATENTELNQEVADLCIQRGTWINVVDDAERSSVTFPSIIQRGPVSVSVSTDGKSPTLARRLKSRIDSNLERGIGALAEFLAQKRRLLGAQSHRVLWDEVIDSTIPDLLESGTEQQVEDAFTALVDSGKQRKGFVSLVGAGPGDPSLLTLKAVRQMERADVVYYDNLVSKAVLSRVRKDAEQVYVGKKRKFTSVRQSEINRLMLNDAQAGKRVVRLKGGDPFLFGRGGEEIETLAEHGIAFEVIPGITAALGCAAYAGIPLTHRDYSQSVRFVTGHTKGDQINLDWPELAKPNQTLVVYMGLANLEQFTANLLSNGMSDSTPTAIISKGTFPDQKVMTTTLAEVAETLSLTVLESPTTAIIGDVVHVRERLTQMST